MQQTEIRNLSNLSPDFFASDQPMTLFMGLCITAFLAAVESGERTVFVFMV